MDQIGVVILGEIRQQIESKEYHVLRRKAKNVLKKKIVLLANYAHKLLGDGKGISSFLLENVETCESWHRAKHM